MGAHPKIVTEIDDPRRFGQEAQSAPTVQFNLNGGGSSAVPTPEAIATARDTAMNPAVVDAFALVISGAGDWLDDRFHGARGARVRG